MVVLCNQQQEEDKEFVVVPESGPWSLRLNCSSNPGVAFDDKRILADSMEIVILAYTTGVGFVPPLSREKTVDKMLSMNGTNPAKLTPQEKMEALAENLLKAWGYIWYVPLPSFRSGLSEANQEYIPEPPVLCGSFFKSTGLSRSATGFYGQGGYLDRLKTKFKLPSNVITQVSFDVTHSTPSGGDAMGVVWDFREPDKAEQKFVDSVNAWFGEYIEREKNVPYPREMQTTFIEMPFYRIDSQLGNMAKADVVKAVGYEIFPHEDINYNALPFGQATLEHLAFEGDTVDVKALEPSVVDSDIVSAETM